MALRSNLIVNYFPNTVTDGEFKEMFAPFGSMTNCKVIKDRQTGQSMGFGFVKFSTDEEAAAAIKALNGKDFGTKVMKVSIARPEGSTEIKSELYTCNLPKTFGKSEIENLFRSYGEVIEVKIFQDPAGNSRGIACVQMGTAEEAQKAIDALNNSNQGGDKPLVAKLWENKRKIEQQQQQQPQFPQYQQPRYSQQPPQYPPHPHYPAYPSPAAPPIQDESGGYKPIRRAQRFDANGKPVQDRPSASPYGRAPRATAGDEPLMPTPNHPADPYAQPSYPGQQYPSHPSSNPYTSSTPAASPYAASPYASPYAQPFPQQGGYPPQAGYPPSPAGYPSAYPPAAQAYPQPSYPQNGMNSRPRPDTSNATPSASLFIFHVPRTMTDQSLTSLFEPYAVKGKLIKVAVSKKPSGEPKGFAFVDFESVDDATVAVEKVNGHQVDGKYLKVSFKQ